MPIPLTIRLAAKINELLNLNLEATIEAESSSSSSPSSFSSSSSFFSYSSSSIPSPNIPASQPRQKFRIPRFPSLKRPLFPLTPFVQFQLRLPGLTHSLPLPHYYLLQFMTDLSTLTSVFSQLVCNGTNSTSLPTSQLTPPHTHTHARARTHSYSSCL